MCTHFLLLIQILPAFVYTQLFLDFIRRSVNIALVIWMYFVFNYCQYMTSGYCSQHSQCSFRAQIHKLKSMQINECSSAFEAIINLTSQGKDN